MINYFHNHLPSEIFLNLGIVKIYYYGLIFALAFLIGYFLVTRLARQQKIPAKFFFNLIFCTIIFGVIGARIYYILFYNFTYFYSYPLEIIKIWQGGIALNGAIIAGILTIYFYTKKYHLNFWIYSDIFAVTFSLIQAIGRWGNYFNQELYGKPTDLPWGIPIDYNHRLMVYENFQYFHPTFFYESVLNLLLFLVLILLFYKKKLAPGILTLLYLISYSLIRFFMEFIRIDPAITIFGIRLPQIICLLIIITSSWILIKKPLGRGNS